MPIQLRKGGTWNELSGIRVRSGGSWRTIAAVKVYSGAAWRTVATFSGGGGGGSGGSGGGGGGTSTSDPMTLAASPTTLGKSGSSGTLTSASITATPSNGNAPFTYAWSKVSQTAGPTFTINSPSLASTTVTIIGLPTDGDPYAVTIHCVATDSVGSHATSNTATVSFTYREPIDTGTL